MADDEWMNEAKARLARAKTSKRRAGTVAARVEALRPELAAARAAGKTWKEIAADLSDGAPLNADAVRIAHVRAGKRSGNLAQPASTTQAVRKAHASAVSPIPIPDMAMPVTNADPFEDMFAPMFDARDTRGRGASAGGERNS